MGNKKEALREAQRQTKASFTALSESVFIMETKHDYMLQPLLKTGVRSVAELLAYCTTSQLLGKGALKYKDTDHACTTFDAINEKGQHILGRNFDYRDAPVCVNWTTPEQGYKSISLMNMNFMLYGYKWNKGTTSKMRKQCLLAPYVAMDGMNEKGLAIDVVEIKGVTTKQDTGKKPISTTVAIRGILDTCATVDEAVSFLKNYDMHSAIGCDYHFHIVDVSGKSVLVEYINNEMRLFQQEEITEEVFPSQYMVNFYLSKDGNNEQGFGYTRYKYLTEAFEENKGHMTEQEAMNLLEKCRLSYRKQYAPFIGHDVTSLWSAVYNLEEQSVTLCARMDYTKQYTFRLAEPGKGTIH